MRKPLVAPLRNLALGSRNVLARLHALCTLDGLGLLTPDLVEVALRDTNPGMRENALRLAETRFSSAVISVAAALTNDPSAKVRLQLACTLGESQSAKAGEALAQIAPSGLRLGFYRRGGDEFSVTASAALVGRLTENGGEALDVFSGPLFITALGVGRRDLIERLLRPVFEQNLFARYSSFLQLLARRKTSVTDLINAAPEDALSARLKSADQLFAAARKVAEDPHAQNRLAALILLTRDPANRAEAMENLAKAIQPSASADTQRAAITAIAETGDARVPELLLRDWSARGPESRAAILEALLRRESWAFEMLKQIEVGGVSVADLDAARRNRLLKHDSKRVRELAAKLFDQPTTSNRAKVIEQFRPALQLTGNAAHGKEVFAKLCATCHQLDGIGNQVGPDLKSVAEHPPEKLLVNILDPNADIQPGYNAYNCALTNGEELYGLISVETATSIVFKFADGTSRTIHRAEINSLRSSNLSLMPEGLEQGLTGQDVADLIAYVKTH